MLERYLPYAAVDPAFKHLLQKTPPKMPNVTTKSKKKIFPELLEDDFSETFSSVSDVRDKQKAEQSANEQICSQPQISSSHSGVKDLLISIKTMPKELRYH